MLPYQRAIKQIKKGDEKKAISIIQQNNVSPYHRSILVTSAIKYERLKVMSHLMNSEHFWLTEPMYDLIMSKNGLAFFELFHQKGFLWTYYPYYSAAFHGRDEILHFLLSHRDQVYENPYYTLEKYIKRGAIRGEHVHILRKYTNESHWETCDLGYAISVGNLEIVKLLHEKCNMPIFRHFDYSLNDEKRLAMKSFIDSHDMGKKCVRCLQEELESIWELEVEEYTSFLQWLPHETLEDIMAIF